MKISDLEKRIEELVDPIVAEKDVALVDLDLKKRDRDPVLIIYLDKRGGGIDLDTIAEISEEISRHLDVADIIDASYKLEIASPGLERVLRKPREFRWFQGRKAEMKLKQPREGGKSFTGILGEADETGFHLLVGEKDMNIRYDEVRKVKLVFEWGRG